MIYDPFLDDLAALPLTLLVHPASEQQVDGQLACWCPFCKDSPHTDPKPGSNTPHFIIYQRRRGGLYGKPVEFWMCTRTKRCGWGAVELYAAMRGYGYWWQQNQYAPRTFICEGEDLRRACVELAMKAGNTMDDIKQKWPQLAVRDYRKAAVRPQEVLTFEPKTDFTPQDMAALGCTSWLDKDGLEHFGFESQNADAEWKFRPSMIHDDFHVYAVGKVTLPAVLRKGEAVSEELISTPWNPIFVALADDKNETCGSIFRPAIEEAPPMVFSTNADNTTSKVSRWLAGDKVFMAAVDYRTSESSGVVRAIKELDPKETYATTKQVWVQSTNKNGHEVWDLEDEEIKEADVKARAVIFCRTAQDAIATYYHLRALRVTYPTTFGERWYHVCWPYGDVQFTRVHYNKMHRFADNVYTLFPSTQRDLLKAHDISCRYRDVMRAQLPATMGSAEHRYFARLYCHPVQTVRDFFLSYKMLPRESFQNDNDLNRLFSSCITSALCSNPFERKERRDRYNIVKEVYYTINPATLWEFMASQGYARDVRDDTDDKIGRYVHIDGPFADELDPPSMVQAVVDNLKAYARQTNDAKTGQPDEYEIMVQAVLRANKEINEKTIASLPVVKLDYQGGYGRHVEHFFYENGALRITENDITMLPYDGIDFNVDRAEKMPWNFTPPSDVPFAITENPEYQKRLNEIKAKEAEKDADGKPLYTIAQLDMEKNALEIWGQSHRWLVDWRGKKEPEMWPALRVLRGFANEDWEREQELLHEGLSFSREEQMELDNRFANLVFCLGRILWRLHTTKSNCIPYLIENVVTASNRAEGGSGKSTFVRIFAGCAAHVLNVSGRDLVSNKEFAANLAKYQLHRDRIVHWEDVDATFDFSKLYNYTTGDFSYRKMYKDLITVPLNEGPSHIVTSNYPLHDLDDSTMRRVCLGGFSHRFAGKNVMKNKSPRSISDIMPDFDPVSPENLNPSTRNQITMICALAVQFVMRYDEKVDAQKKYMDQRTLTQSLGEAFLRFAHVFFSQSWVYGVPVDLDSMLVEYKNDFAEASKNKTDSFSPKAFKRRILDYCETDGIVMNPPQLFRKKDGTLLKKAEQTNYFAHQAWCTCEYFTGKDWEDDTTVQPKQIRELKRTDHAVYFYRKGVDNIPADNDELTAVYNEFKSKPDPAPILDEQGEPVRLTEEERTRWRSYLDGKQRKRIYPPAPAPTNGSAPQTEDDPLANPDMPF